MNEALQIFNFRLESHKAVNKTQLMTSNRAILRKLVNFADLTFVCICINGQRVMLINRLTGQVYYIDFDYKLFTYNTYKLTVMSYVAILPLEDSSDLRNVLNFYLGSSFVIGSIETDRVILNSVDLWFSSNYALLDIDETDLNLYMGYLGLDSCADNR